MALLRNDTDRHRPTPIYPPAAATASDKRKGKADDLEQGPYPSSSKDFESADSASSGPSKRALGFLFSAMRPLLVLALCALLALSLQSLASPTPAVARSAASGTTGHDSSENAAGAGDRIKEHPRASQASTKSYHYLSNYTATAAFPVSAFASFYQPPASTTVQPRPAITNGVSRDAGGSGAGGYFPDQVAEPYFLPTGAPASEAVFPKASASARPHGESAEAFAARTYANVTALIDAPNDAGSGTTNCTRCVRALRAGQALARAYPEQVPGVLVDLCKRYKGGSAYKNLTCEREYAPSTLGASYAQLLSYAVLDSDTASDGRFLCANLVGTTACPTPDTRYLSPQWLSDWFAKSGASASVPADIVKREEAKRAERARAAQEGRAPPLQRVAHLSDIHLDPRYLIGAEAACTNGQCCRADSFNATTAPDGPPAAAYTTNGTVALGLQPANISQPAPYWGAYRCDSPWGLVANTISSVQRVVVEDTARQLRRRGLADAGSALSKRALDDKLAFTLFTGDMVTHESGAPWHLTRELIWYTQQAIFDSFHRWLGSGPTYSAIGNHDTVPADFASPNALSDGRGKQFSWDWKNVARLFKQEGWITRPEDLRQVETHYAGYSVRHRDTDLRIVTLNTDMWYKSNAYNFLHTDDIDYSGMLRFLTDELAKAEKRGEAVWIVGHVLAGWSGTNGLKDQTNLFYQIVARFSPYTIRGIFLGHMHETLEAVHYANNGTVRDAKHALNVAYMAPSITPGTNVNPSFRIYDVDPASWEIMDYHQYYTQAADFPTLPQMGHGPVWSLLYSARETYGNMSASLAAGNYSAPVALGAGGRWPNDAPLNGSFWGAVTDEMVARPELMTLQTKLSGRNSPRSPICTEPACIEARICYMRSGSSPLGQECPQGYDSVQSPFHPSH